MDTPYVDHAHRMRLAFREFLARDTCQVMPGGFSPLFARMAQEIGFEAYFVAGSQMSSLLLGVPDNGIIGLRDVVDHARHVAARTDIPIFVDLDTGYGNAVNVHYAVQEAVRAGVAGIQIEDQEAPKKSGTIAGRRCIPIDEAVGKYKAAVAARNELDPSFVICARCDLLGAEAGSFEEAVERCAAYVTDGGVDFVWLNTVEHRDHLRRAAAEVPAPVLTIWSGREAEPTLAEYTDLGVRVALYPTVACLFAVQSAWRGLDDLKERGKPAIDEFVNEIHSSKWKALDRSILLGGAKVRELEEAFLPKTAQRDYDGTWGHVETVYRGRTNKPPQDR